MSSETAIVFGGSSGLGEATVRELAGAGHKVTIADLNAEKGEQLAAELGVGFVLCDVTDSDQVEAAIAKTAEAEGEDPVEAGVPRGGVVADVGFDDPEHAGTRCIPRLQRRLAQATDEERAEAYASAADDDGRDHDARRVRDLSDGTVSHEWISSLAPSPRHTLEPDGFVDTVRLRLGAADAAATHSRACARPFTVGAAHPRCCAPSAATRGHDELRD